MRRSTAAFPIIALLGIALYSAACRERDDPAADAAAIHALIERTEAMNNSGDIEGWVALFDTGGVYMPPGQPAVTTAAGLREAARSGFTNWRTNIRIVPTEVVTSGDWAFARSTVSGTATPSSGGAPIPIDVKQLAVYHRQGDGSWRIARLITNSNGS